MVPLVENQRHNTRLAETAKGEADAVADAVGFNELGRRGLVRITGRKLRGRLARGLLTETAAPGSIRRAVPRNGQYLRLR
jgi:hypothetical protein